MATPARHCRQDPHVMWPSPETPGRQPEIPAPLPLIQQSRPTFLSHVHLGTGMVLAPTRSHFPDVNVGAADRGLLDLDSKRSLCPHPASFYASERQSRASLNFASASSVICLEPYRVQQDSLSLAIV